MGTYAGALFVAGQNSGDSDRVHRYDGSTLTTLQPTVTLADSFLEFDGALYFVAGLGEPFLELYRHCDGSESIERVTTLFDSNDDHFNHGLIAFGDRIYFLADEDLTTGRELWSLDPMQPIFCDGFRDGDDDRWSSTVGG